MGRTDKALLQPAVQTMLQSLSTHAARAGLDRSPAGMATGQGRPLIHGSLLTRRRLPACRPRWKLASL